MLDQRLLSGYKSLMIRNNFSIILGLSIPLLLSGCEDDNHDHPQLITGKQLFQHHCAGCHLQDGNGILLKGYPPIKNTSLKSWQIRHKIQGEESEGRNMPSFKNMSKSEARLIADYIKTLN